MSCIHGHHTTFVIRRARLCRGASPRSGGPSTARVHSLRSSRRITECCAKSWPFALGKGFVSFVGSDDEGSLAGVAPTRPVPPSPSEFRRASRPKFSAPPSFTTLQPPSSDQFKEGAPAAASAASATLVPLAPSFHIPGLSPSIKLRRTSRHRVRMSIV